jgi:hypothetical protein
VASRACACLNRTCPLKFTEIAAAWAGDPKTVADLMPLVFHRALDGHQMSFAFGELVAHLNYLVSQGTLQCDVDSTGLRRFSLNQQASKNGPETSNLFLTSSRPPLADEVRRRSPSVRTQNQWLSSPLQIERRRLRHHRRPSCRNRHAPSFSSRNQRTAQESRNRNGKGKSSSRSKIRRRALFALAKSRASPLPTVRTEVDNVLEKTAFRAAV